MKHPFLHSEETENLSKLLLSTNRDNVEVGFQILSNYLEVIPKMAKELVLLSELSWHDDLKEKAQQYLEQEFSEDQLDTWKYHFQVFDIYLDLYDPKSYEENWYLFEAHEAVRPDYMPLITQNSDYAAAYFSIAEMIAEYYKKRLDWAERYYYISLESNPYDLNVLRVLANLYKDGYHDYEKSLAYYNKMLAIDKTHYDALEEKGVLLYEYIKNIDAAIDVFEAALVFYKNDEKFTIWLADIYMLKNTTESYPKGKKILQDVLEKNPNSSFAWNIYANRLWITENKPKEAEEAYLQGIKFNPKSYYIFGNLAELYDCVHQEYEKADEYYVKAFALYSDDIYHMTNFISLLVLKTKDLDRAKDYYTHIRSLTFGTIKREPELNDKQWDLFQQAQTILFKHFPTLNPVELN
jgi:tetratricopeptide (TPR) repeat protein